MDKDLLKNWREWIEVLFPLLLFLGIYLFRPIKHYAKAGKLKEIAPFLNGRVITRPFSMPRIEGSYMGIPYRITFSPPGRGSPGKMQIQIEYPGFFGLTLTPRSRSSGLEEIFQKGRLLSTNEEGFNKAVVAKADREREKAMLFLESQSNRAKILNIFQAGFALIRITEKGVTLVRPGDFLTGTPLTPDQAVEDLTLACRLVQ